MEISDIDRGNALQLYERGYRQTSRKHCMVARIENYTKYVSECVRRGWSPTEWSSFQYEIRVRSKARMTVSEAVLREIRRLCDERGYMPTMSMDGVIPPMPINSVESMESVESVESLQGRFLIEIDIPPNVVCCVRINNGEWIPLP